MTSIDPLVLIVEDDPLLSDLVSLKLKNEQIPVSHVVSGEAAIEFLQQDRKPDLILLDIRLPGIDGFGVLEQVRANEATKDIPVIIFSNFGEDSDRAKAEALGATKFVVKISLSLEQVVDLVKEHLKITN